MPVDEVAQLRNLLKEVERICGELAELSYTPYGSPNAEKAAELLMTAEAVREALEYRLMDAKEHAEGGGTQHSGIPHEPEARKHPYGDLHGLLKSHDAKAVQYFLQDSLQKTSRTLPDIQGLSSFQTQIVRTFLDDYIESGQPMNLPILRNRLAQLLPNELSQVDLERIARTETSFASQRKRVDQIKERHGPEAIKQKQWYWITAKDNRVCEFCKAIASGGTAKFAGRSIYLPGNPYRLDELRKLDDLHTLSGHSNCRCQTEYKPRLEKSLKLEKSNRFVSGWAHVEVLDSEGDIILIEGMKNSVKWWAKHSPILHIEHNSMPIAKVVSLKWKKHSSGFSGLWLKAQLYKGYKVHEKIWREIKAGNHYKGFSIKGIGHRPTKRCQGKLCERIYPSFDLVEISLVGFPANPLALLDNDIRKLEKCLA